MPDEDLVRSALAGDGSALAELAARHKSRVFALVSRFTRDPHRLDGLAQEIFLRAWRRLGQFHGETPFDRWLSRIAVQACLDFLRRRRIDFGQPPAPESPESADPAAAPQAEARERVETALARLKPEERLIATLLELEGKSIPETAELTGWSAPEVEARASQAREALKAQPLATAREAGPHDTSRIESGFEARLAARMERERTFAVWPWRLLPLFAALAIVAGWSAWRSARENELTIRAGLEAGALKWACVKGITGKTL